METTRDTIADSAYTILSTAFEQAHATSDRVETSHADAERDSSYDSDWDGHCNMDYEDDDQRLENWHDITDKITQTIRKAFADSPTIPDFSTASGRKAFQSH